MTPQKKNNGPDLRGRIRAMLHGVAFGDALGAPVEKLSAKEIRERYGRVTSLRMDWHRTSGKHQKWKGRIRGHGISTDDTAMTLALMRVYEAERRHLDAWDMAEGMVREVAWKSQWIPELQRECPLIERLYYPEKWIFQRLQLSGCDPRQGGVGNMVNCGAAMYIAPVGAVNACDPKAAYDEAIAFASAHQQSYGLEAAGVLAAAVAQAFVPDTSVSDIVHVAHGLAKDGTRNAICAIAEVAEKLAEKGAGFDEIADEFHRVISDYSFMGDDVNHTPEKAGKPSHGYQPSRLQSIEELPLALGFCITANGDFYKAVSDGINSGRDTDSIGVMAGSILGAMHGPKIIDQEDAALLDTANDYSLSQRANEFCDVVQEILRRDAERISKVSAKRHALYQVSAGVI